MKANTVTETYTEYRSEAHPDIMTTKAALAPVIEFIDANPLVVEIVNGEQSAAFGVGSCEYIGWAQNSTAPAAVIEKVRTLMNLTDRYCQGYRLGTIWNFKGQFTFEHYRDEGFTGGFFQQHDKNYPRLCTSMDYTPVTLPEVVKAFADWCDGSAFITERITIDGADVPTELWKAV
ncbi:MAG: hypothetical protein J7K40_11460 [candidate division Zixibacteria bacterium]|nr:hypothetical protein [candidate division Zixibacteria bacterium]